MALSAILGFVFIVMLIRLLAIQQVGLRFFLLMGAVGVMLLFSILSMISTVGHARDLDGRHAASRPNAYQKLSEISQRPRAAHSRGILKSGTGISHVQFEKAAAVERARHRLTISPDAAISFALPVRPSAF